MDSDRGFDIMRNSLNDIADIFLEMGMEQHGDKILYNGIDGQMMDVNIFVGPIYYQRLKPSLG